MATFLAPDGTRLAYRQVGEGRRLICVPGGPMQASAYLGDLGGLPKRRSLVLLDLRGTGESGTPADPAWPARLAEALALLREHIFKEQDGVFPEALATLGGADWEAAEAVRSRVGGSLSRPAS